MEVEQNSNMKIQEEEFSQGKYSSNSYETLEFTKCNLTAKAQQLEQQNNNNQMELNAQQMFIESKTKSKFGPKIKKQKRTQLKKVTKKQQQQHQQLQQNNSQNLVWEIITTQQEKNYEQQNQEKLQTLQDQFSINEPQFLLEDEQSQKKQLKTTDSLEFTAHSDTTNDSDIMQEDDMSMHERLIHNQRLFYKQQEQQQKSLQNNTNDNNLIDLKPTNFEQDYKHFVYYLNYEHVYMKDMLDQQPDLQNCLQNTQITPSLRSKMVDWSMEVLGNYSHSTTNETFFRAAILMDSYFKYTKKPLTDSNVHLIGIASMYISSKLEDIYHITLQDFVQRVAHNKYTKQQIKQQEQELLEALDYDITFPHPYQFMELFLHRIFGNNDNSFIQNIQETSVITLKMCTYEIQMYQFPPSMLAVCSIIFSLDCFFEAQLETVKCKIQKKNLEFERNKQRNCFIDIAIKLEMDLNKLDLCFSTIQELVTNFQLFFPGLNNIQKYQQLN